MGQQATANRGPLLPDSTRSRPPTTASASACLQAAGDRVDIGLRKAICNGADACRAAVRFQLKAGADAIKRMPSCGVLPLAAITATERTGFVMKGGKVYLRS